jgi:Icc-related predicted phosphoesterase
MDLSKTIDVLKPDDYDENTAKYRKISVVVVSDTHKHHQMMTIPDGDIFLHCGDFTNRHDWSNLSDDEIPQSIIDFNEWLGKLKHRHKIVIHGNHEIGFKNISDEEIKSKYLTNCIYLNDELIEIEGINIYGSSWTFTQNFQTKWSIIPSHVDILMTHVPPQFILDLAYQPKKSPSIEPCSMCNNAVHGSYGHWGSQSLYKEISQRIQPRVHCFGHVHDDPGFKFDQDGTGTLFINAAADLSKQSIKFNFYIQLQKH